MLTTSGTGRRRRACSASIPVNPHRLTGRGGPRRCGSTRLPDRQASTPVPPSRQFVDRIDLGHLFHRLWLPKVTASETLQVSRDDDGFTLIDLLLVIVLVIVIVGIISVPLAAVVLGYLRGADATTARLAELRRSIEPTAATRAVTTGRCGEAELAERYDDLGIVLLTSNGRWGSVPLAGD
jgi:hypothetical protein